MTQRIAKFGWKPDKPDYRDKVLPKVGWWSWARQPTSATLNEALLPAVRNQGDSGSCTGFSTSGAAMFVLAKEKQPQLISALFPYYNGRLVEDSAGEDAGAEIRDVIKGMVKYGACQDRNWPFSEDKVVARPSSAAYNDAKTNLLSSYQRVPQIVSSIRQCIIDQKPIVFGFSVYENFESEVVARTGLMPMPNGTMIGGHAVWIVAYDDNKKFLGQIGGVKIMNSWGPKWGDQGFFWMPYKYLLNNNLADDFWSMTTVT